MQNPWPQWPLIFRVDYGHEEAKSRFGVDPRVYAISTKEFICEDKAGIKVLKGLRTVKVEWVTDENGRRTLKEVEGSEKIHECDLCILAMGFIGPEKVIHFTA